MANIHFATSYLESVPKNVMHACAPYDAFE